MVLLDHQVHQVCKVDLVWMDQMELDTIRLHQVNRDDQVRA